MTTPDRTAKRRARRIAADEAHAWARNLRLNNPHAKLTLSMLSLYVDGDGYCFVAIPTLADDTELSAATVRNRLAWLEQIGAIARTAQWVDEYGRRNGDSRGKRTSDLIRLMIDLDEVDIEASADRGEPAVSREVSPAHGEGLNPDGETVSPEPALRQPFDSAKGLISEPEPESPPKTPSGGESEPDQVGLSEPEHFGAAWLAWRGHEAMRRDLALDEFRKLPIEKQRLCRAAIPLFNALLDQLGRTRVPNFHLWIKTRGFEEFPGATLDGSAAASSSIEVGSAEGRAIVALYQVARVRPFEHRGRISYPLAITPQLLALADAPPRSAWPWIEDRQQIAAWSGFLGEHVLGARPPLVVERGVGDARRSGIDAPWPWPPRKDGTLSEMTQAGEA